MSPAPYLDSEQLKPLIAQQLAHLDELDYDYDRDGALPLRPDVREYLLRFLLRPDLGPVRAGGLPAPAVVLNHDGTATLSWTVAGPAQHGLSLHVPCRGVIAVTRKDGGARVDETLRHLDPVQIGLALDPQFEWLRHALAESN